MIDTVDKDIDVKLKDMMLEVRTSMHYLVNNRDGKPERFDDIIVTEMMKSQFHKWQRSFVRACLTAPRRRSGSMGLLPLASCTVFQVLGVLAHSVVVFSVFFF